MELQIQASPIIRQRLQGITFGLLRAYPVRVAASDAHFDAELKQLEQDLLQKFPQKRPAEDAVVGHVRRMYRKIGWEPTRYRPSSEALVRRLLKGKGLYRINNLVDYGNLVSARFHLPMGLYDTDKINGPILVDVGREGESYQGISRDEIHAAGKMILRDDAGIFGNPTADSRRTSISAETKSVLAVFFCPHEVPGDYLNKTLDALQRYYAFCNPQAKFSRQVQVISG